MAGSNDDFKKPSPLWLEGGAKGNHNGTRAKKHERRVAKDLGGSRRGRSNQLWHDDDRHKQFVSDLTDARVDSKAAKTSLRRQGTLNRRTTDMGDAKTPLLHVEHKFTDDVSIRVTREWLDKVSSGARQQSKDPCLVITFLHPTKTPEEWALIPKSVLERLIGKAG